MKVVHFLSEVVLMIYADNAATTKLDIEAYEAMLPWLVEEYGNASQPYAFARKPKNALAEARMIIAECINSLPEEIFFTSGGTESNNWAIKGAAFSDPKMKATITTSFEHNAVLRSCEFISRIGYPVDYIMPTSDGFIPVDSLREIISNKTHLVSVIHTNNEIGTMQPIKELCGLAHSHGALFHTDAVQAAGHIKIDVKELDIDMLSASAHKFNGPKGIGFLYIRKGTKLLPYLDGGTQENKYRAGTENIASIIGMAIALKGNCLNIENTTAYIHSLETMFMNNLHASNIPFVRNGGENTLPGLISLSFYGVEGESILHRMDLSGIYISTGSACNSKKTEISHVLKAIKINNALAKGTIRISLGKYNTEEDVHALVKALTRILPVDN